MCPGQGMSDWLEVGWHRHPSSLPVLWEQVEGNDQMRYLHHRMQSCPEEQELLRRASALAAARQPDTPPPLPLRPLQVATVVFLT